MTIYLDDDFRCYTTDGGGMTELETELFDGKCPEYIEGYRYVPGGETWVRSDGTVFTGRMIAPRLPYDQLAVAQSAYERGLAEADDTIAAIVDEIYSMDMEEIENV
jgi:hypothetical protein